MRISRNMMFDANVRNMNNSLADMMRLNEQTASQKKLNRPSDDPGGAARSIELNSHLAQLEQYDENIGTAQAWLSLADEQLNQASDLMIKFQELAEQAATGTLTADQRETLADESRELMMQMVALANTEYAGDSIFAGTEVDGNAYEVGLGATIDDATLSNAAVLEVTGEAENTIYMEFTEDGVVGVDELEYRYTTDGGDTWQTGTLAAGDTEVDLGTARMTMANGSVVTATPEAGTNTGTGIWIRPAVFYQGDDTDGAEVAHYGNSSISASVTGDFPDDVAIRVDNNATLPGPIEYSYSLDNGATWVEGNVTSNSSFSIPGGHVDIASNGGNTLTAGEQFIVEPHIADITIDIGPSSEVVLNSVGKDIFGGQYIAPGETYPSPDPADPSQNMFEAIGEFIGYLETNNQDGIAESLALFETTHEHLTTAVGEIGGRESRVEFAEHSVNMAKESTNANISSIEDADITQLTTDLAKSEFIYQAVLQTSADIMQMSLLNYI